jgi:hypothetical protein
MSPGTVCRWRASAPPAIRSRLVLAGTTASSPTRLVRGTAELLRGLKYADLGK